MFSMISLIVSIFFFLQFRYPSREGSIATILEKYPDCFNKSQKVPKPAPISIILGFLKLFSLHNLMHSSTLGLNNFFFFFDFH